jgi:hypothetical protein
VHALLAHRKLATMFVERGGLGLLLNLPRNSWTHAGVARCLYALSAVAVVIETCFIADDNPHQVLSPPPRCASRRLRCFDDATRHPVTTPACVSAVAARDPPSPCNGRCVDGGEASDAS